MNKARFTVPRLDTKNQMIAIVEADVEFAPLQALFLPKLREAIAAWINKTKEGREAWDYSSEDFNVGDLAGLGYESDTPLGQELAVVGIHNLDITIMNLIGEADWHYDTVLGEDPEDVEEKA